MIQSWSKEEAQRIFELSKTQSDPAMGFGYLCQAHLMDPSNFEIGITLAAELAKRPHPKRMAVLMAEMVFQHAPANALTNGKYRGLFHELVQPYLITGNMTKAHMLAQASGDETWTESIQNVLNMYRRPMSFFFVNLLMQPDRRLGSEIICRALLKAGCQHKEDSFFHVGPLGEKANIILIQDETELESLGATKFASLQAAGKVVCTSKYLKEQFCARVPFFDPVDVHTILLRPLSELAEVGKKDPKKVIVRSRYEPDRIFLCKRLREVGMEVVEDTKEAAFWVYVGTHISMADLHSAVLAQADGAVPYCSAIPALSEYICTGHLFRQPFTKEQMAALVASIKRASDSGDVLAEGQKVAAQAREFFDAAKMAIEWIEFFNRMPVGRLP